MRESSKQSVLFPDLFRKPVRVAFDEPNTTSDGGAVLLKQVDERLGLTGRLARCLVDRRQPGKVRHRLEELLRQRVYGIACGYEDANDAGRLKDDPLHKLLVGRDPFDGEALASQPTLSRFENGVRRVDLYRMGVALAEAVIAWQRRRRRARRVKRITIDLDATADETHGGQQLSLFNGHYGCWCYLPLLGYLIAGSRLDRFAGPNWTL